MSSNWYFSVMQILRLSTEGVDVTSKKCGVNLNVILASKKFWKKVLTLLFSKHIW